VGRGPWPVGVLNLPREEKAGSGRRQRKAARGKGSKQRWNLRRCRGFFFSLADIVFFQNVCPGFTISSLSYLFLSFLYPLSFIYKLNLYYISNNSSFTELCKKNR
jgi:hypothetical protein